MTGSLGTDKLDPIPVLTTSRMLLRAPSDADLQGLAVIYGDAPTARQLGRKDALDTESVPDLPLEFALEREHGWSIHWSCIDLKLGAFVGLVALYEPNATTAYLSYAIVPKFRRRGYASEAIRAVLSYASTLPHTESLVAHVQFDNAPSSALLVSLGFADAGTVQLHRGVRREFRWAVRRGQAGLPEYGESG